MADRQVSDSLISGQDDLRKAYQDERVAQEYVGKRFESPLGALLHARQVRAIRRAIQANGVKRAVELAPGPARLSVDVVPLLQKATLVDTSAQMLKEAARRLRARGVSTPVSFVQADAFRLPIRDRHDLVYTFRLIRHFDQPDRLRLYKEIHSILRPGGCLVFDAVNETVSAPLRARAKPGEYEHFDALLRADQVREELHSSGFGRIELAGVQHRYGALTACQVYLAPRSGALARGAMELFDRSGGEPLEWVVTCHRE